MTSTIITQQNTHNWSNKCPWTTASEEDLFFFVLFCLEDVPLVEFMYLVFTRMPGESYRKWLRSLLLYLCYVFRALINSLGCWFWAESWVVQTWIRTGWIRLLTSQANQLIEGPCWHSVMSIAISGCPELWSSVLNVIRVIYVLNWRRRILNVWFVLRWICAWLTAR